MRHSTLRNGALLVGVAVLLAGCLGGTSGVPATSSPTDSPSPTPTPVASPGSPADSTDNSPDGTATDDVPDRTVTGECEAVTVTTVDPAREDVSPDPLPERPSMDNATAVREYAAAYERAYVRNTGLERDTTQYEVYAYNASVRAVENGYLVTMTAGWWYNEAAVTTATATPTVVHADGPEYRVAYLVLEDRLLRSQAAREGGLAPWTGTALECWPGTESSAE